MPPGFDPPVMESMETVGSAPRMRPDSSVATPALTPASAIVAAVAAALPHEETMPGSTVEAWADQCASDALTSGAPQRSLRKAGSGRNAAIFCADRLVHELACVEPGDPRVAQAGLAVGDVAGDAARSRAPSGCRRPS